MSAPLEQSEAFAGLADFEKHLVRSGVLKPEDISVRAADEIKIEPQPSAARNAAPKIKAPDAPAPAAKEFALTAQRDGDAAVAAGERPYVRSPRSSRRGRYVLAASAGLALAGAAGMGAAYMRHDFSPSDLAQLADAFAPKPQDAEPAEPEAQAEIEGALAAEEIARDEVLPPAAGQPAPANQTSAASAVSASSEFLDPKPVAGAALQLATADAALPPQAKPASAEPAPSAVRAAQRPAVEPDAAVPKPVVESAKKAKPIAAAKPKAPPATPSKLASPAPPRPGERAPRPEAEEPIAAAPPAAKPAPAPESGPMAYLKRAQQAAASVGGTVSGTVKGWIGLGGSAPAQ